MKKSLTTYCICACIITVLLLLIIKPGSQHQENDEIPSTKESPQENAEPTIDKNTTKTTEIKQKPHQKNTEPSLEDNSDTEIRRLQEFLDDNDTENTLAQCEFLVESDSPARRYAVISALEWVDSPKAGIILSKLLKDANQTIAEDAQSTMETLMDKMSTSISEDTDTKELVSDKDINEYFDMCTTAIKSAKNSDAADQLMSKIDGLDPKLSIPILLDVLENSGKAVREIALEHLDHVTNGHGIKNREEAMLWLMNDQNIKRNDQK